MNWFTVGNYYPDIMLASDQLILTSKSNLARWKHDETSTQRRYFKLVDKINKLLIKPGTNSGIMPENLITKQISAVFFQKYLFDSMPKDYSF
jgi:hypothetical protein